MTLKKSENFLELTDPSDIASAIEAKFNESALEVARIKNLAETDSRFDGIHCLECTEEIPIERLKLDKIRCVECQTVIEKKNKFYTSS